MTSADTRVYRLGEFHRFDAAGAQFLYLVPAGAIFAVDTAVGKLIDCLTAGELPHDRLIGELAASGLTIWDAEELIAEMYHANVIVADDSAPEQPQSLPEVFPIQTLVMNLTNQCNLSCQYCYEFGADKVATPEGKPKFMDLETAKASVDFLLAQSGDRRSIHITFFGGETLMNFPLLKAVVAYASERAGEQGRHVDFSLTTNATLLTPAIIEFLSENRVGVTVSMDGPKEMHDHLRVFANGRGSYDIIEPKVRALIQNHRTRPITARVTLTSGVSDVIRIFRHLKQDLGFHEVGFAPVTTSPNQLYAIGQKGMDGVLEQFHTLAAEYLEYALRGEAHGFSNVSDTLAELCQGVNKSHPCGAGLGCWAWDLPGTLRRATVLSIPMSTRWDTSPRASTAGSRLIFYAAAISIPNTIATRAGRGPCALAAATTKHSYAMEIRAIPISTIAIGYGTGPTRALRSMARSRPGTRVFWSISRKGKHHETHATTE